MCIIIISGVRFPNRLVFKISPLGKSAQSPCYALYVSVKTCGLHKTFRCVVHNNSSWFHFHCFAAKHDGATWYRSFIRALKY